MRRRLLSIFLLVVLLASCVHYSPYREEHYFQAMGREGEFVLTVSNRSSDILSGMLSESILERTDRLSIALGRDGSSYGAAEGNFGYAGVNALLEWSPDFRLVDGDPRYFQSRSLPLEAAVPRTGVLLFSSSSYVEAYERTIASRYIYIPDEIADEMAAHDIAIYVSKPASVPDIGIAIPDETAQKIDMALLLFDEDHGNGYLTGWLDMDSESAARTMTTILRNELLKGIRERGERPDFALLSGYFRQDGDKVYIDYPGMNLDAVKAVALAGGV